MWGWEGEQAIGSFCPEVGGQWVILRWVMYVGMGGEQAMGSFCPEVGGQWVSIKINITSIKIIRYKRLKRH